MMAALKWHVEPVAETALHGPRVPQPEVTA